MRRIAANYIFPITSDPICNGYVDVSEDGTVIGTGRLTEETGSTEYYNGILVPGFTNAHCHIELSHLEGVSSTRSTPSASPRPKKSVRKP